ncbi:hypothetical protein VKT23_003682 [Stygiomarasmius scandens]|uniref:Uncharacterized protein n=1 Tax=Marasmiellus scandens TaxID=2682957 RepID=A0ABR1K1Y1_9AGAR
MADSSPLSSPPSSMTYTPSSITNSPQYSEPKSSHFSKNGFETSFETTTGYQYTLFVPPEVLRKAVHKDHKKYLKNKSKKIQGQQKQGKIKCEEKENKPMSYNKPWRYISGNARPSGDSQDEPIKLSTNEDDENSKPTLRKCKKTMDEPIELSTDKDDENSKPTLCKRKKTMPEVNEDHNSKGKRKDDDNNEPRRKRRRIVTGSARELVQGPSHEESGEDLAQHDQKFPELPYNPKLTFASLQVPQTVIRSLEKAHMNYLPLHILDGKSFTQLTNRYGLPSLHAEIIRLAVLDCI